MQSLLSASVASFVTLTQEEGFSMASESRRFWKREMVEEVQVVGNGLYCVREKLLS
jgi:hypothetical protein